MTAFRTLFEGFLTNTPNFEVSVDEEQYVKIDLTSVLGAVAPAIAPASSWTLVDMATRLRQVINPQLDAVVAGLSVLCEFKSVVLLRIRSARCELLPIPDASEVSGFVALPTKILRFR